MASDKQGRPESGWVVSEYFGFAVLTAILGAMIGGFIASAGGAVLGYVVFSIAVTITTILFLIGAFAKGVQVGMRAARAER